MHTDGSRLPDCSCYMSHDVTLMQILHSKVSTYFGNSDTTSHSIISRWGLESFVYTNRTLIKLCRWKLRGPVIMNHRVMMCAGTRPGGSLSADNLAAWPQSPPTADIATFCATPPTIYDGHLASPPSYCQYSLVWTLICNYNLWYQKYLELHV